MITFKPRARPWHWYDSTRAAHTAIQANLRHRRAALAAILGKRARRSKKGATDAEVRLAARLRATCKAAEELAAEGVVFRGHRFSIVENSKLARSHGIARRNREDLDAGKI